MLVAVAVVVEDKMQQGYMREESVHPLSHVPFAPTQQFVPSLLYSIPTISFPSLHLPQNLAFPESPNSLWAPCLTVGWAGHSVCCLVAKQLALSPDLEASEQLFRLCSLQVSFKNS